MTNIFTCNSRVSSDECVGDLPAYRAHVEAWMHLSLVLTCSSPDSLLGHSILESHQIVVNTRIFSCEACKSRGFSRRHSVNTDVYHLISQTECLDFAHLGQVVDWIVGEESHLRCADYEVGEDVILITDKACRILPTIRQAGQLR